MLIAHLTDTHLGIDSGALGGRLDPAAALRRALARVRALAPAPAVLLLTGDLTEAGRAADYTLLAELLKQELRRMLGKRRACFASSATTTTGSTRGSTWAR